MPKHCLADTDPLPPPQQWLCSSAGCGIYIADKRTDFSWGRNWEGARTPEPFRTCQKCRDKSLENQRKSKEGKQLKIIAERDYAVEQERLSGLFQLAQSETRAELVRQERVATDTAIRLQRQQEV